MASLRPQWPDVLDVSFREIYNQGEKDVETHYQDVFNMLTSSRAYEKDSSASGLSKLVQVAEASAIPYEDENQGYDVTYNHNKFALGTQVSQEMYDDDQFNVMSRKPRKLAVAKTRTMDQAGADIFNYGFTAGGGGISTFTSGDALALFSSAHTRTDGGTTISNTTTADLAEDSIEVAMVAGASTLDDKGQLAERTFDTLLIPPVLEKEARILLNTQLRVGTSNNDINPYEGKLRIVVWKRLGSTGSTGSDTAWFLLDSSDNMLNYFIRTNPGLEGPVWDFDVEVAKWKTHARWKVGFTDWRGTWGSKGDNS